MSDDLQRLVGAELEMASYRDTVLEELAAVVASDGCWGDDVGYFAELLRTAETLRAFPPIGPSSWE